MTTLPFCFLRMLPVLALLRAGALFAAGYDPLFAANDRLQVMLDGPFAQIDRERDKDKEYPGTLSYTGPDGAPVVLDVEFEVRGNYRLRKDICQYAQLWVNLKTRQAQGTLFENQDRIKLAVQCRRQQSYAGSLVREHQAYRMFSRLTDLSFAARLAELTFRDTQRQGESHAGLGFFIEHQDRLAARLGLQQVDIGEATVARLDPAQASLVALFMYMIANTDYSMLTGEPGEDCCHNIRLFKGRGDSLLPIPFDFDFAGFVDAPYAEPSPELRQRSVRQRLYRGFCGHNAQSGATLARFREQRAAFAAIVGETLYVSSGQAARAREFIDGYFTVIDDAAAVTDEILGHCR